VGWVLMKEVSADLLGGMVDGFDVEAGDLR
jgi:hypothetical protein